MLVAEVVLVFNFEPIYFDLIFIDPIYERQKTSFRKSSRPAA